MKPLVLKADTALLRALIEADPELKLQISASVLKNVSDDAVNINVNERVKNIIAEMSKVAKGWDFSDGKNPWRSNDFHEYLKRIVLIHIKQASTEVVEANISKMLESAFELFAPEFQKKIDAMIQDALTPEMLRKHLDAKLASLAL